MESLEKLKCLYQKILTCGITDDQTRCKEHSEEVEKLVNISGITLEEMKINSEHYNPTSTRQDQFPAGLHKYNHKNVFNRSWIALTQ